MGYMSGHSGMRATRDQGFEVITSRSNGTLAPLRFQSNPFQRGAMDGETVVFNERGLSETEPAQNDSGR